jgi:hypothetical protein
MEERTLKLCWGLTKTTLIPPNLPKAQEMPLTVSMSQAGKAARF